MIRPPLHGWRMWGCGAVFTRESPRHRAIGHQGAFTCGRNLMAVVRKAGWERNQDTGQDVFRVTVEYRPEDNQPTFPMSIIWKETPVEIVVADLSGMTAERP